MITEELAKKMGAYAFAALAIEHHYGQHPKFPKPDYSNWHDRDECECEKLEGLDAGDAALAWGLKRLAYSTLHLADWIEAHAPPIEEPEVPAEWEGQGEGWKK